MLIWQLKYKLLEILAAKSGTYCEITIFFIFERRQIEIGFIMTSLKKKFL